MAIDAYDHSIAPGDTPPPDAFFDGRTFVPESLGQWISCEAHLRLGHDGRLWRYVDGCYQPDGDTYVRARVRELLVERFRRSAQERRSHLTRKLTTPSELEGLLVQAVHGLRRLRTRGRFELPATVAAAGDQYRDRLDTVRGFLAEECVINPDAWVARPALYKSYRTWAQGGGRFALSAVQFYDHLRRNLDGAVSEHPRRGVRGFAGLGLLLDQEPSS